MIKQNSNDDNNIYSLSHFLMENQIQVSNQKFDISICLTFFTKKVTNKVKAALVRFSE